MNTSRSKWADLGNVIVVCVGVGFAAGYLVARRVHRPPGPSQVLEYVGEARHVDLAAGGSFEVAYPRAYAHPPELRILTEEMRPAVDYELLDQRTDGFRIKVEPGPAAPERADGVGWLRYRAKGSVPAAAAP